RIEYSLRNYIPTPVWGKCAKSALSYPPITKSKNLRRIPYGAHPVNTGPSGCDNCALERPAFWRFNWVRNTPLFNRPRRFRIIVSVCRGCNNQRASQDENQSRLHKNSVIYQQSKEPVAVHTSLTSV